MVPRLRERERKREARRGTDATGNGNTAGEDRRVPPTGDPHRGEGPAEGPPPEGRATQGTHTEHKRQASGDPHREEDPAEDPPPEGRATQGTHTEDTRTPRFRWEGAPCKRR